MNTDRIQTQQEANAFWADKEVKKWVVQFTHGRRGRREARDVCVSARTATGARKAGIEAMKVMGHSWAASAASTVRLATAQDLGCVHVAANPEGGAA